MIYKLMIKEISVILNQGLFSCVHLLFILIYFSSIHEVMRKQRKKDLTYIGTGYFLGSKRSFPWLNGIILL